MCLPELVSSLTLLHAVLNFAFVVAILYIWVAAEIEFPGQSMHSLQANLVSGGLGLHLGTHLRRRPVMICQGNVADNVVLVATVQGMSVFA